VTDSGHLTRRSLLALARAHRPIDDGEQAHQLAMIDWLDGVAGAAIDPFDRNVFDPGHATGSCFVVSSEGRAAMIFHRNLKLWVQPGGHADPGETDPCAVAAREAEEELGVSLDGAQPELFDLDVHRIAPRGGAPSHLHFDFRSLAVIEPRELAPATDAAEARWMTRSEISAIGVDVGVRRMADKAVARGLLAR
jgi:8-oxo-dGTP pyrophosphatase MutT (NUDIX family)